MFDALRIFTFLCEALERGQKACLVTVTDVTGASVRNPGAHMAVTDAGEMCGSLSGGCIEQAVAGEAMGAIEAREPRMVAYGAGSPIIDIRLPCGGRVDLLFTPLFAPRPAAEILRRLRGREPASLVLSQDAVDVVIEGEGVTGWRGERFVARHLPPLQLAIAGHGGTVEALVRQAEALGIQSGVASPDAAIVQRLEAQGIMTRRLTRFGDSIGLEIDRWTAAAFFFHDHDWEERLIADALASPAFFVGAMGSRVTHAERTERLRKAGLAERDIARIVAPIGLIPSSRDPDTLALSTLVQVVDVYNALVAGNAAEAGD